MWHLHRLSSRFLWLEQALASPWLADAPSSGPAGCSEDNRITQTCQPMKNQMYPLIRKKPPTSIFSEKHMRNHPKKKHPTSIFWGENTSEIIRIHHPTLAPHRTSRSIVASRHQEGQLELLRPGDVKITWGSLGLVDLGRSWRKNAGWFLWFFSCSGPIRPIRPIRPLDASSDMINASHTLKEKSYENIIKILMLRQ